MGPIAFLLSSVFLFTVLDVARCLKCHHCTEQLSLTEEICKSNIKTNMYNLMYKECSAGQVCIRHELPETWDGMPGKIIRDCGYPNYCRTDGALIEDKIKMNSLRCLTCEEDFCNSTSNTLASFLMAILSCVVFLLS